MNNVLDSIIVFVFLILVINYLKAYNLNLGRNIKHQFTKNSYRQTQLISSPIHLQYKMDVIKAICWDWDVRNMYIRTDSYEIRKNVRFFDFDNPKCKITVR
jgi:hypothetical protein